MFKMRSNMVTLLFVMNVIVVKCSNGVFQFRTIKPKLYPFVETYSATYHDLDEEERDGTNYNYKTVMPHDLAWMVVILEASHDFTDLVLTPLCLGIVITTIDILTTCSCMMRELEDKVRFLPTAFGVLFSAQFPITDKHLVLRSGLVQSMNLLVKPKTNIVSFPHWDNDLIGVNNIVVHENCQMCNNTSYNDLAIITVGIIDVIRGIVEPIPKKIFFDDQRDLTNSRFYKNCYIVVVKLIESEYNVKPREYIMERRQFTIWDVPSPHNELTHSEVIVGRSVLAYEDSFVYERYAGAPLMCEDQDGEHIPVGMYLGLACGDINVKDLKTECSRYLLPCEDCYPPNLKLNSSAVLCNEGNTEVIELAIRLNSFNEWLDEYSFELPGEVYLPFQKTRDASKSKMDLPRMWCFLVATSFFILILYS